MFHSECSPKLPNLKHTQLYCFQLKCKTALFDKGGHKKEEGGEFGEARKD